LEISCDFLVVARQAVSQKSCHMPAHIKWHVVAHSLAICAA